MSDSPALCRQQPAGRGAAEVHAPEASAGASESACAGGAGAGGGGGPRGRAARSSKSRAVGFHAADGCKAVAAADPGPGAAEEDKAAAAAKAAADDEAGEYELRRRVRIAENQRVLEALGLSGF